MDTLLAIKELSLSVPTGHILQKQKLVLDRISFEVREGEPTAYLGANGAGKTSTFRILCGLCQPTGGQLLFKGKPIPRFSSIPSNGFGFMPEQPYFYRNLTPRELLTYLGNMTGKLPDLKKRIDDWAERLHFSRVIDQRLGLCSKGQIQRVGIAQALLHSPDFILLDEPLSGLDPLGRESIKHTLLSEMKRGATLLFSSHILSDVASLCQRIVVLDHGKIVYQGRKDALMKTEQDWLVNIKGPEFTLDNAHPDEYIRNPDQSWTIQCKSLEIRDQYIRFALESPKHELLLVEPKKQTLEEAFVGLLTEGHGV